MARGEVTPWMERALQMLQDSPQSFDALVADAGALIPPGRAWREREVARTYPRNRIHPSREPTDESLWVGRRQMMRKYLWGWTRDGKVIAYHENGHKMFALKDDARE